MSQAYTGYKFHLTTTSVSLPKTGDKLLIKPSKEFLKKCRNDIREIFLSHIGKPLDALIGKMNPVIRGKANYMNKVVSSRAFNKLDTYLFVRQVRFVKRTHPNKPRKWRQKYWGKFKFGSQDKWVFGNKENGNYMQRFAWTKISRHTLLKGSHSPDDPSLIKYWEKRNAKKDKSEAVKFNRKQEYIAFKQGYKCSKCGQSLFNDEPLHLHHIIPKNKGGKDEVNNLTWLHIYCHHKTHYEKE